MVISTGQCERCRTPLEAGDLRCSICGEVAPAAMSASREHLEVKIMRCTGCGAAVAYDPEHQAPSCSFCDEVMEIETLEDPMEQSEGFLPFTLDQRGARQALKGWLGSRGWFCPSDLKSAAKLEQLRPLWWVGWLFDAHAFVSWAADSNAGSRRSSWAPHAGQTKMTFEDILVPASRGLNDREVDVAAAGCDISTAQRKPRGVKRATIEQFDVQRSQARREIVSTIESLARDQICEHHIPGHRYRNVNVSVLLRGLVTSRLAFPAWVLAYRYNNKLYRVVVCGQDGTRVTGEAPTSLVKILLVVVGLIVGILLGIAVGSL